MPLTDDWQYFFFLLLVHEITVHLTVNDVLDSIKYALKPILQIKKLRLKAFRYLHCS